MPRCRPRGEALASSVPDVLAPGLDLRLLRDQPGARVRGCGGAFREPAQRLLAAPARRRLHAALYDPQEQHELPELGYGLTNAAYRTTPGSGDLRRGDFDQAEFEARIEAVAPRAVAFVGKEAYRGLFGTSGPSSDRRCGAIGRTGLFVLPSTSPANAAVPYAERLRWFEALRAWLEPVERQAVARRSSSTRTTVCCSSSSGVRSATAGGARREAASTRAKARGALRRELREEVGLDEFEVGPVAVRARRRVPVGEGASTASTTRPISSACEPTSRADDRPRRGGRRRLRWWTLAELSSVDGSSSRRPTSPSGCVG